MNTKLLAMSRCELVRPIANMVPQHNHASLIFVALVASLLFGCAGSDSDSSATTGANDAAAPPKAAAPSSIDPGILESRSFGEAPSLAEMVASGELPPVSERLPENPLVVRPLYEIGKYGGTLRHNCRSDATDKAGFQRILAENMLGFRRPLGDAIELNLAERYSFSDDGRTALFTLRKGVKWSDGMPLTVDDILFWYYDIAYNDSAREDPLPRSTWLVDGKPITFEKVDDHTLRISSTKPLGQAKVAFCYDYLAEPKHHWSRFHPAYNPEATYEDFRKAASDMKRLVTPGVPRISAWIPHLHVKGQKIAFARNPWYWKIDTAGNQLPYADHLVFQVNEKPELALLRFINSEFDFFSVGLESSFLNTLSSAQEENNHTLRSSRPEPGPALFLNWDTQNAPLRQAFRDRDVRVALSLAINREEIAEAVYAGLLLPQGCAWIPGSPYYSEDAARKHAAYDPDQARKILEQAGYRDSDGDGIRELRDGSPFSLVLDVPQPSMHSRDGGLLVADHWKAIGVEVHLNPGLLEIIHYRRFNNEFDVLYRRLMGSLDPLERPEDYAAITSDSPFWHRNAYREGPPWFMEVSQRIKDARITADDDSRRELVTGAGMLLAENVPIISIGSIRQIWASHNRLGNVPENVALANYFRGWSRPLFHEQVYIK